MAKRVPARGQMEIIMIKVRSIVCRLVGIYQAAAYVSKWGPLNIQLRAYWGARNPGDGP